MRVVKNMQANVRVDTGECLGVVSNRYQIVQNIDAFDILDHLMEYRDIAYETAGSLRNGQTVWALIKLPEYKILDDEMLSYLLVANSHHGQESIKVVPTNVRVVCNNTLNMALENAKRSWYISHLGDIKKKKEKIKESLDLLDNYKHKLLETAKKLSLVNFSRASFLQFVDDKVYPIPESEKDKNESKKIEYIERKRLALITCYDTQDINNFRHTKWGVVSALSDHFYHDSAKHETIFTRVLNGHPAFDKAYKALLVA